MPFGLSLKKLIRRDPTASLRDRADELRGSLSGQTRRAVVAGTAAAAVPLPVFAKPTTAAPSALARACDAATAHLAWINDAAQHPTPWVDERLHSELDKVDDVLWRVADEPAAGLDDLSAKARLILANDGQHLGLSHLADDRAILTLLREVVALSPTRSLPPAPTPLPIERAEHRDRLLAAYAEDRASRPVGTKAKFGTIELRASDLVQNRSFAVAKEVIALPPPRTVDGLALAAVAAAILTEVDYEPGSHEDPTAMAAVYLTRAALAFTSASLPPGFVGFGDEPDCRERDDVLHSGEGALPAWAIAQAEAECTDDEDDA